MKRSVVIFMPIFLILFFVLPSDKTFSAKKGIRFRKMYYFQHRVLPHWTYNSNGKFFNAMMKDDYKIFNRSATKLLGEEYASKIKIKKFKEKNAVLITFPEPAKTPLCYFIFIIKQGENSYKFFTYEKTYKITAHTIGVVGGWTKTKRHQNFGSRKYKDAKNFIEDVEKILSSK
jgi:hypothetical protein